MLELGEIDLQQLPQIKDPFRLTISMSVKNMQYYITLVLTSIN